MKHKEVGQPASFFAAGKVEKPQRLLHNYTMMIIKEAIIVEGRDDTAAVNRAVDAATIETHGFGIREETWERIEKAAQSVGIIVFTDPDHAGEQIRKRITERFPDAKEAFLDVAKATAGDDIGIENAEPEDIRQALSKARCTCLAERTDAFTAADMSFYELTGDGSFERRRRLGEKLGIGYANSKTFLKRLNKFGVSRQELEDKLKEIDNDE